MSNQPRFGETPKVFGLQQPPTEAVPEPGKKALLATIGIGFWQMDDGSIRAELDESPTIGPLIPNALLLMAQLVGRYSAAMVHVQAMENIKKVQVVTANQIAVPRNE